MILMGPFQPEILWKAVWDKVRDVVGAAECPACQTIFRHEAWRSYKVNPESQICGSGPGTSDKKIMYLLSVTRTRRFYLFLRAKVMILLAIWKSNKYLILVLMLNAQIHRSCQFTSARLSDTSSYKLCITHH